MAGHRPWEGGEFTLQIGTYLTCAPKLLIVRFAFGK